MEGTREKPRSANDALAPVKLWHSIAVKLFGAFVALSILPVAVTAVWISRVHSARLYHLVPTSALSGTEAELRWLTISIVFFTAVLALAVSFAIAQHFGRPVRLLTHATRQVAQGNLRQTVRLRRADELGRLIAVFNQMVGKLREVEERNRNISQLKSQFVSVAAHQLRTPLSGIRWALKMLLQGDAGPLQPEQQRLLTEALQANEALVNLVHNLLEVARIEEGRFGYTFREVVFSTLLDEVVSALKPFAQRSQVTVAVASELPAGFRLVADPDRLRLVLSNLLDNAIRYSHPASPVTLSAAARGDWLTVSVGDHGIGIATAEQDKVFTRFYRASNAVKHQTEGSGLGLFIAKSVIERHGGTITLTSIPGKGTTVTFTLPLRRELLAPAPSNLSEFVGAI